MNILIHGFPHSGTSILKSIFGHIEEIYEYPYEANKVYDFIKKKNKKKKIYILIKFPFTSEKFLKHNFYKNYITIFVIRDPYYIFTSINKRFGENIEEGHKIEDWKKTAELFVKYQNKEDENIYCIRYEDFFENNFKKIKRILDKIGLQYNDSIFNNENKKNVCMKKGKILKKKPSNKDHINYRTWQINQKFENFNLKTEIKLKNEQIKKLKKLEVLKILYY